MKLLTLLPLLTLTVALPTDSSEEPVLPLPKPNDLYNCPPPSRHNPLLSKGASPLPPEMEEYYTSLEEANKKEDPLPSDDTVFDVNPWFNTTTTTPLTRRDVAGKPKQGLEDPYSFNHGPIGKVHPWKNGEGPWRWGWEGKRYSRRGCGNTCRLKCRLNKANLFYRMFTHPQPVLAILFGKTHNLERMKSDCNYVCGAFCEYSTDITQEEMAAHFGVKLSVQTREYYPDGSVYEDDDGAPVSYSSFPDEGSTCSKAQQQTVRFKNGKMLPN